MRDAKIELKIPTVEDREGLKVMCNAVDRTYLTNRLPYPYTDESADWWINMVTEQDGKTGLWRVIYYDGVLVGNTSVEQKSDVYDCDAELGYMVLTEYWGKGIATAAAREICALAFEKLDITRITSQVYAPNAASIRVLEKTGFVKEGILKNAVRKNGQVFDLWIGGLYGTT